MKKYKVYIPVLSFLVYEVDAESEEEEALKIGSDGEYVEVIDDDHTDLTPVAEAYAEEQLD
jgi:hypothetical protein